jgi:hypothetical protein
LPDAPAQEGWLKLEERGLQVAPGIVLCRPALAAAVARRLAWWRGEVHKEKNAPNLEDLRAELALLREENEPDSLPRRREIMKILETA